jgi:hypothetical protein
VNDEELKEWNFLGPTLFWIGIGYILIQSGYVIIGGGLIGLCLCQKHKVKTVLLIKIAVVFILVGLIIYSGKVK